MTARAQTCGAFLAYRAHCACARPPARPNFRRVLPHPASAPRQPCCPGLPRSQELLLARTFFLATVPATLGNLPVLQGFSKTFPDPAWLPQAAEGLQGRQRATTAPSWPSSSTSPAVATLTQAQPFYEEGLPRSPPSLAAPGAPVTGGPVTGFFTLFS